MAKQSLVNPPTTVRVKLNRHARNPAPPPEPSLPRIVKLLALAHHFQHLLHTGQVKDLAEIARLGGITRARATQIANLAFLAPEIQERLILEDQPLGERPLRALSATLLWADQVRSLTG